MSITKTVSVEEAKTRFVELISLAEQGHEILIVKDNQPKVKLVSVMPKTRQRVFGQHRGKIHMHEDFDAPLPENFWLSGHP
jgi:prevent-host-death family protein